KLTKGAYENKWRPSIDVTFRSAAVAYRQNCIGIILSGLLDDGVSGMRSIQECGGATIIQNPEEAEFPDMPLAVQDSITVDHSSNLAGMGKIIDRIMKKDKRKSKTIPRQILIEAEVAEKVLTGIDKVSQLGEQSTFSC